MLGLVADMALLQTLGVSSLLLIGVGYIAGRYRELLPFMRLIDTLEGVEAVSGYAFGRV